MTVQAILGTKGFEVISIEADAKLSDAIRVLTERHVGAVLVMKDHHIEGILSERDVVRVLGSGWHCLKQDAEQQSAFTPA